MTRKLSKTNMALIFFLAILLLSVYAQIAYQTQVRSDYYPSYAIHADKLADKPAEYFTLANPDQYVLRAINGESYINVHYDDTQINELVRQYGTNNIVYKGSYYTIGIAYVDSFPPLTTSYISWIRYLYSSNSYYIDFSGCKALQATDKVDLFPSKCIPTLSVYLH
jgi:hypothetical protein